MHDVVRCDTISLYVYMCREVYIYIEREGDVEIVAQDCADLRHSSLDPTLWYPPAAAAAAAAVGLWWRGMMPLPAAAAAARLSLPGRGVPVAAAFICVFRFPFCFRLASLI